MAYIHVSRAIAKRFGGEAVLRMAVSKAVRQTHTHPHTLTQILKIISASTYETFRQIFITLQYLFGPPIL